MQGFLGKTDVFFVLLVCMCVCISGVFSVPLDRTIDVQLAPEEQVSFGDVVHETLSSLKDIEKMAANGAESLREATGFALKLTEFVDQVFVHEDADGIEQALEYLSADKVVNSAMSAIKSDNPDDKETEEVNNLMKLAFDAVKSMVISEVPLKESEEEQVKSLATSEVGGSLPKTFYQFTEKGRRLKRIEEDPALTEKADEDYNKFMAASSQFMLRTHDAEYDFEKKMKDREEKRRKLKQAQLSLTKGGSLMQLSSGSFGNQMNLDQDLSDITGAKQGDIVVKARSNPLRDIRLSQNREDL
eukprot:Nk52_evm96s485 gene=Nk52_evmTU96s485